MNEYALHLERERQNTIAAKQRFEAKVEKLENLVEAIDKVCGEARATIPPMRAAALADRVQDLIDNNRASQRNL
jgi:hypothetical protein